MLSFALTCITHDKRFLDEGKKQPKLALLDTLMYGPV